MNLKLFPIAGSFLSCLLGISEATAKPAVVQLEDLRITCAGPAEYTQVWNAEDLRQITEDMLANNSPNLKYRQCADIELPAEGFLPIGYYPEVPFDAQGFKGEYLGQGFRISGHRPPAGFAGDFGLFRRLDGARISNLRIIGSQYFGPAAVAGALAGTINDGTILEGITISEAAIGSSSGHTHCGALAGLIFDSSLTAIDVQAVIGARSGLAWAVTDSTIDDMQIDVARDSASNSYDFAGVAYLFRNTRAQHIRVKVDARARPGFVYAAGFAILLETSHISDIVVSDSDWATASVEAGGIAIWARLGTIIERARVYTDISAASIAGGIVARSDGATIRDSLYKGTIQSDWTAGGIVGTGRVGYTVPATVFTGTLIERCGVRNSEISARGPAGGIVGELTSSAMAASQVIDSYALANLQNEGLSTDYTNLGGIVGLPIGAQIDRALFSGAVTGGEYVGGITGVPFMDSIVQNAIYNGDLGPSDNGEGLPVPQSAMQQEPELYSAFDLSGTWVFLPGSYPELRSIQALRVDSNADTAVTTQDLYEFLHLYFSALPGADFNGDEILNPTDVFSYISAWLAAL